MERGAIGPFFDTFRPLTSAMIDEIWVWLKDKVIPVDAKKAYGGVEV
jgi:hypothetical protein